MDPPTHNTLTELVGFGEEKRQERRREEERRDKRGPISRAIRYCIYTLLITLIR
jgi:hypothetical protein